MNHVPPAGPTATDPVCGMAVQRDGAKHRLDLGGQAFFFCCARCRDRFAAAPDTFLSPKAPLSEPAHHKASGGLYTCPMDPEIRQEGPGSCPICGMALEPLEITAESPPNAELADMTRRLRIASGLTLPVFLTEMAGHLIQGHGPGGLPSWVQLCLTAPVILWAGWPFFRRGWASVVSGRLNMFTLIAVGTGSAWLYSVFATLAPSLFPAGFRGMGGGVPVYFESASVIIVLVLLGQVLELRARERTGQAIRALLDLAPKTACRVKEDGADEDVPLFDVQAGDRLRVRPGEAVPVDGVVLEGNAAIDASMLTGEAMPVAKGPGAPVIGGTICISGSIVARAEKVGAETMLARIVQLVAQSQRSRAPIQRLADRVAGYFVPAVAAAAVAAFAGWSIWGPPPALAYALIAFVSVLIIACPCALGLATPMSVMVGIGRGAGMGILIRSAEALERFGDVDTLVVDKTGTLTEGKPVVTDVFSVVPLTRQDVLRLAASLERSSAHPLAAAIETAAHESGAAPAPAEDFAARDGLGVVGRVNGSQAALGNAALMASLGIDISPLGARADACRADGKTVVFVSKSGCAAGLIAIADPVKPTSRAAVDALRADGMRVVMLTGDHADTARSVARALDIEEVWADALPQDKGRIVRELRAGGNIVAMAGDGVNDAPALAEADVGIAMGAGAQVAIESAGITLVQGDLGGIVRARALSRMTMRNIRQNLMFAFAYNAIGIPLAAGVLFPVFGLVLSPMLAALAMSLSSVCVVANALRLRTARLA